MIRGKKKKQSRQTKRFIITITLLYSVVMLLGSTYSWYTRAEERTNRFESKPLAVKLTGDFLPFFEWVPSTVVEKNIAVANISESPAVVRVSLEEVMLLFEINTIDLSGNGNIKEITEPGTPIKLNDVTSWQRGNTIETAKDSGRYYRGSNRLSAKIDYKQLSSRPMPFLDLNFNQAYIKLSVPLEEESQSAYWLYEDGYFYYSEVIQPGEESQILLSSIAVPADIPNYLKGRLYQLNGDVLAYTQSKNALTLWQLDPSNEAYKMLVGKLY